MTDARSNRYTPTDPSKYDTEIGDTAGALDELASRVKAHEATGAGDVTGPASSTDNAIARFDSTTGKLIQNGLAILSDLGSITGLVNCTGSATCFFDSLQASSQVDTDVVGEYTPAAGVTVDGVLVKDGLVDGRDVATDGTKLDGIATGANLYVHPNHSGDVTSVADGAQTIAANAVTNAKAATMAEARIKGRAAGAGTGDQTDLTAAQVKAILTVGHYLGFSAVALSVTDGVLTYMGVGTGKSNGTEANAAFYLQDAGTISDLSVYVSTNGSNGTFVVTLMDNGSAGSVTTTHGAGVTGVQTDTANSFAVTAGHTVSIRVKNNGSFSSPVIIQTVTFKFTPD